MNIFLKKTLPAAAKKAPESLPTSRNTWHWISRLQGIPQWIHSQSSRLSPRRHTDKKWATLRLPFSCKTQFQSGERAGKKKRTSQTNRPHEKHKKKNTKKIVHHVRMFSWSQTSTKRQSSTSASNAHQYPGKRSSSRNGKSGVHTPLEGSIRPPTNGSELTRAQHLESYLKDPTLQRSTRKVSSGTNFTC